MHSSSNALPASAVTDVAAPRFVVLAREPVRPVAVLLAFIVAALALFLIGAGLAHSRSRHLAEDKGRATRAGNAANSASEDDDKDDPSQVDTVVLGDPADAPVPAQRGGHAGRVHATVIVHLPRFGTDVGLIPNSPAGHLLYSWLAAFNRANVSAMAQVLPNSEADATSAAQMQLRQQTGGFNLLSAKEIAPGLLLFRLRDQTPDANEVLGTLQVRPGSAEPAIGSLSLRAVP